MLKPSLFTLGSLENTNLNRTVEYPINGLDYPNNRSKIDYEFNFFKNNGVSEFSPNFIFKFTA